MTFSELREAVQARFRTLVAEPQGLTTIQDNGPPPAAMSAKWCRLRIPVQTRQQAALGGPGANRFRTIGQVMVDLHAPGEQGAATLTALVDAIKVAFQRVALAAPDLRFTPPPSPVGEIQRAGGWAMWTVAIPYQLDEVE